MKMLYLILPIVTVVSVGMRILPFLIGPSLQRFAFLQKLSMMLPSCLLILICAHTMKDTSIATPEIMAISCVLLTQYLFRTIIISMAIGIAVHQLLMHLV